MKIKMYPKAHINPAKIPDLVRTKGSRMRFTNGEVPYFTYYFSKEEIKNTETYMECISGVVGEISNLKEEA